MPNNDDRYNELRTFALRMVESLDQVQQDILELTKRINGIQNVQDCIVHTFVKMHPDQFSGIEKEDNATSKAYRAFYRTHPEVLTDLDRADAILGIKKPGDKPKS
jgi:hypothetical protein